MLDCIPPYCYRNVPQTLSKTPTTIHLQNETLAAIDRKSYLLNMSRNKFICQCIDFAMQHGDFPLQQGDTNPSHPK